MMRALKYLIVALGGAFAARKALGPRTKVAPGKTVPPRTKLTPLDALDPRKALRRRREPGLDAAASRSVRRKQIGLRAALGLAILAMGGFLVAASGIIPIKASSGHWAITEWFLNFSMSRSVATHSLGIRAPDLSDPALIMKGAGHFETGCRPCHGAVEPPHPLVGRKMMPYPPGLPSVIPEWKPAELFYIVKHGVKFTGMPAWPALRRDDEVWAMVAFLRRLPELDPGEYERLVFGEDVAMLGAGDETADTTMAAGEPSAADTATTIADTTSTMANTTAASDAADIEGLLMTEDPVLDVAENCERCHGPRGRGRETSAFPRLAGQRPQYTYAQLIAYARGHRHSGIMQPVAASLSEEEIEALAGYFARGTGGLTDPPEPPVVPALGRLSSREENPAVARGRRIALEGVPEERVPSCADCHGPGATRRNPFYPTLAGQYADYIVLQLKLFKQGTRGGSVYAHLMEPTAPKLTDRQMRDVALYYESLGVD